MPSSYTSSLRLTLQVTGENSGTWGNIVNNGVTSLVDASVAGTATVVHNDTANYTLSTANGATDEARQMFLNITGTLTAARNVVCPTASKLYFLRNNTTGGFAVTLKTSGGTGISVPNGKYAALYCDGTNVVDAFDFNSTLIANTATNLAGGATGSIPYQSAASTTAMLAAGTNGQVLTLAGGVPTWAASTGGVTSFSAGTTGLTPSTGTTGAITLAGTLDVDNGGTGQTSYTDGQLLIGNTTGGNTLTKSTLTAGSGISITNGAGSITIATSGGGGTITGVTATSPVVSSGGTAPDISLSSGYGDTLNPYASKTANFVLAAPNGSAGVPTFRAIVAADVPTLNQNTSGTAAGLSTTLAVGSGGTGVTTTPANGALLIGNGSGYTSSTLTAGSNITITNASGSITIAASGGGGGGVTSVTGTAPVASSGGATPDISLNAAYGDTLNPYASKTANFVLAAPDGTAGVPTFRAIVAADIPTLNQNTSGTAAGLSTTLAVASGGTGLTSTPANGALDIGNGTGFTRTTLTAGSGISITNASGAITIASTGGGGGVTSFDTSLSGLTPSTASTGAVTLAGTLGATSGGTGLSTYATGDIIYASASNTLAKLTAGSNTQVLTLAGGVPTWAASAGGASGGGTDQVFFVNGQTVNTSYSIPSSKNAMSAGPITVANGAVVTVPNGSRWVVI
jgi:hypothetical protein